MIYDKYFVPSDPWNQILSKAFFIQSYFIEQNRNVIAKG